MLDLTESVARLLVDTLAMRSVSADKGFRLTQKENKLLVEVDSPGENDRVIWYKDSIALLVDKGLEDEIGDAVIALDGDQLVIRPTSPE